MESPDLFRGWENIGEGSFYVRQALMYKEKLFKPKNKSPNTKREKGLFYGKKICSNYRVYGKS